jgi:hypothetical protein
MTVRIHLLGYLARYSPSGQEKFKLDLAPEATVGALLESIQDMNGVNPGGAGQINDANIWV